MWMIENGCAGYQLLIIINSHPSSILINHRQSILIEND
jgi:hypothetical protein